MAHNGCAAFGLAGSGVGTVLSAEAHIAAATPHDAWAHTPEAA